MGEKECYTRDEIKLHQIFERGGEIFRVISIRDEPTVTVSVRNLVTGKLEDHAITSCNFAEFRRLDNAKEKGEALRGVIKKLLKKMSDVSPAERVSISNKIREILEEIKKSES